ncbi:hypothetical protein CBR_g30780 [Chara braunii]|uniref:RCC1-like domain-containing protein n=1 Tax=Chara braunii TaxID=69332 RepID=A0A388JXC5_CHABU|nr:hypothetical protein CBR_g30780 [Chara braunii]|eukprot:GBG62459.1 hypothetical protein CBR_g30780 [Chara braunii]
MAGSNMEGDGMRNEGTGMIGGLRDGSRSMKRLPAGWTKKVFAWGAGEDGQLGLGNTLDQHWPKEVQSLTGLEISQLVSGSRNSLAVCGDGSVLAWGWNQRGTLGHPPSVKCESTPSKVKDLSGIVQAAIGGWHCLAVDVEGRAYAWGGNEYGQCAARVDKNRKADQQQSRFDVVRPMRCATQLRVRQVAAGGMHSLVLTDDGQVWTWGQPLVAMDIRTERWKPVRVPGLENVMMIASGAFHCVALCQSQEVMAWGNCEYGQLGLGDTQPRACPQEVTELTGKNIVDIAAGGWHSMALSGEGELYAWGRGEHGRLGFGEDKSSKVFPQRVTLLEGERIIQVSCGGTHSVALTEDGRAYTFGRGDNGRLGYGSMQTTGNPHEVVPGLCEQRDSKHYDNGVPARGTKNCSSSDWKVTQIAAGGRHSLVLAVRHTPHGEINGTREFSPSANGVSYNVRQGRRSKGSDELVGVVGGYQASQDSPERGEGKKEGEDPTRDGGQSCNGCSVASMDGNGVEKTGNRPSFNDWVPTVGPGARGDMIGMPGTVCEGAIYVEHDANGKTSGDTVHGVEQLRLNEVIER